MRRIHVRLWRFIHAEPFSYSVLSSRPSTVTDLAFLLDDPPASNTSPLPYEKHTFPSIPHPMGMLSLSAKYLSSPNFQLDELESLHSSRFLSLDEESDFTPTLAMNQARDSMSALAGPSTSLRTSLPKSPPSSNPDSLSSHHQVIPVPTSPPSR
ncbi:hypothetical protein EDD17DRAFT_41625 [Pisolithus thermaeus]|nr:hypothetical protein EDD17DRAFT_41625 [Pisolithus thermaeus]